MKNDSALGIESFLAQSSLENQNSLETIVKRLVPYDFEKPDLLKRLFEESYLGNELFNKFYGTPSIFNFNISFLEKEDFIPTRKTLDALSLRFGNFAIYSEKPRVQGMYLLEKNDYKEYFDKKASIFFEDMIESGGSTLCKPNPTLFIELTEKLVGEGNGVAYVGDGVADALLIENAQMEGLSNLSFLGVLCSSQHPNKLLSQYIKHEADAIMTDVNDVPNLLASLGGKI